MNPVLVDSVKERMKRFKTAGSFWSSAETRALLTLWWSSAYSSYRTAQEEAALCTISVLGSLHVRIRIIPVMPAQAKHCTIQVGGYSGWCGPLHTVRDQGTKDVADLAIKS